MKFKLLKVDLNQLILKYFKFGYLSLRLSSVQSSTVYAYILFFFQLLWKKVLFEGYTF